jgi:hypothetical protein
MTSISGRLGQRDEGVEVPGGCTGSKQDAHGGPPLGPARSAVEAGRPDVHAARDECARPGQGSGALPHIW